MDCYLTKILGKGEEEEEGGELVGVVGGYITRAAKALVVSEPIVIFYPRDRKS